MIVTARGLIVAGSAIDDDGVQIRKATLHDVSNETRADEYRYDDRSRLESSTAADTVIAGPEQLSDERMKAWLHLTSGVLQLSPIWIQLRR